MNTREHVRSGNALFLMIIFAYILINLGVSFVVQAFHVSFSYVELILIVQIGYAAPAIWYACKKPEAVTETIRLKKISIKTVLLLIMFAFAIMPLMNLISMLSLLIGKNHIQSTVSGMLTQTNLVVCLLAIGILPAILEEFVYRGVVYNEQRQGNVRKAIVCSGLFFGLLHMNINQFSYAFAIGIILALTVEATGSILGPMIVHATINSRSMLLSWTQSKVQADAAIASSTLSRGQIVKMLPMYAGVTIFATAVAVVLFFLIMKSCNKEEEVKQIIGRVEKNPEEEKVPFLDVYFILAVSIAVLMMIGRELK